MPFVASLPCRLSLLPTIHPPVTLPAPIPFPPRVPYLFLFMRSPNLIISNITTQAVQDFYDSKTKPAKLCSIGQFASHCMATVTPGSLRKSSANPWIALELSRVLCPYSRLMPHLVQPNNETSLISAHIFETRDDNLPSFRIASRSHTRPLGRRDHGLAKAYLLRRAVSLGSHSCTRTRKIYGTSSS